MAISLTDCLPQLVLYANPRAHPFVFWNFGTLEIPPLLLQFGGSLLAIFALFILARAIGLGTKPVLSDDAAVQVAANTVEDGFEAVRISIARSKRSALAKDASGRIMVIKLHGNQFAGRILTQRANVREEVDGLLVDTGEARFGVVRMSLTDAPVWADAINRL